MVQCEERKQRLKMGRVTCSHAFPNVTKSWDDYCYRVVPAMWPMYSLRAPFSSTMGHDKGLAGVVGGLAGCGLT